MDQSVKRLWIEALRSGKYIQTFYSLRDIVGKAKCYCALGVLVAVAEKQGVEIEKGTWMGVALPPNIQQWAGLSTSVPEIKSRVFDNQVQNSIMALNDTVKLIFSEIADIIEADL